MASVPNAAITAGGPSRGASRMGMAVMRFSGRPVTSLGELREAVAAYATPAGEKLRAHGLVAGRLAAFFRITTGPTTTGSARSGWCR